MSDPASREAKIAMFDRVLGKDGPMGATKDLAEALRKAQIVAHYDPRGAGVTNRKDLDLCPDCSDQFLNWFDQRKNDDYGGKVRGV